MLVEIITKKKNELTKKELLSCKRLNFGASNGQMKRKFNQFGNNSKSRCILAKHRGKVVGWAFLYPHASGINTLELHVYVAQKFRKCGIGTLLLKRASLIIKRRKAECVFYDFHSQEAKAFYKHFTANGLTS